MTAATSVASRSISLSVSRSASRSQTPLVSVIPLSENSPSKLSVLIDKLDFDQALTTQDQGAGIRIYHQCYEAVLAAQVKYEKLQKAGKWDAPFIPSQNNFISLVTSRTMWYNQYKKNFEQVERYPEMIEWLQESAEALSDMEIWGFEQKVYQWSHLHGYFACDGKPLEPSQDESEVQQPKKKKMHWKVKQEKKKDKGKAKAKAKEASSDEKSDSSESAPPPRKNSSRNKK